PIRLPAWALACGAVLCSSLGAVTAIAYANSLDGPSQLERPVQPVATGIAPTLGTARPPEAAPRGLSSNGSSANALPTPPPALSGDSPASSATAPPNVPGDVSVSSADSRIAPVTPRCPPEMVWLEGGEFMMGTDSKQPALSLARPAHRVRVHGFCIGTHEVTTGEYAACADAGECTPEHQSAHLAGETSDAGSEAAASLHGALCNAGRHGREDHPINCVSHAQAAAF